jgi:hypothetical protein
MAANSILTKILIIFIRAKAIEAKMKAKIEEWPYHVYEKEERLADRTFRS